jgi:adenylate kinase family enzyme
MHTSLSILGPPAVGKSTIAREIATELGLDHFSVREHFAREIAASTAIGRIAQRYRDANRWLPDGIVASAVRGVVGYPGAVFDGFPGNHRQARLLDELLDAAAGTLLFVVYLEAPPEVTATRAAARRVCVTCDGGVHQARVVPNAPGSCAICGTRVTRRPDDVPSLHRRRLRTYCEHAGALLEYLAPRVFRIDATAPAPVVLERVRAAVVVAGT